MSALEPATPTPTVRVRGLQHSFGRAGLQKQVLFDNHLDIYPGEIVVMTGPSGSGKTTLLTLIGALRTVQEGSLEVCGCELHDASARQLLEVRRKIGFIFQAHNLFESLTARQNVRMGMELFGWPVQQMNRRADEMLARLGLDHRIHYKPGFLSGGQKQRVAIARALAPKPKLVLADEPTAALDAKSGREVVTLFRELADQLDVTILMVTHDNRILDVADRIVNMVDGQIKSNVVVQESALICDFLQKVPIFERMPPSLLADVADRMRVEQFPAGAVIIRQGDPGDNFYLIRKGRVAVSVERDGKSRFIAEMGEGDCFGETALLTGQPRNATVRAAEDSVLYALGKVDFQAAIDSSESLHVELQKVFFARQ